MIYFIEDLGDVKIGFTSGEPLARLAMLQTGNPRKLKLLAQIQGDRELERNLHERFINLRLEGEWFSLREPLQSFIYGIRLATVQPTPSLAMFFGGNSRSQKIARPVPSRRYFFNGRPVTDREHLLRLCGAGPDLDNVRERFLRCLTDRISH